MISFPPCKINLGLNVLSKREDGFHNLETCFFPVQWTDILEVIPASETSFSSTGIEIPGRQDNLCLRAYQLLRKYFDIRPVKIHLHKIIPIGAGLGGGSSDAAYMLRMLNSIFNLTLSVDKLRAYAAELGSDCSFFVGDQPMLGSGRGEILDEIDIRLSGYQLVIVKPHIHVSTKEAYAGLMPKIPEVRLREILAKPVSDWKNLLTNDFEKSIFERHPEIAEIKNLFYAKGAEYASMSGSGSSVFGVFKKSIELKQYFPNCDYWSGVQ
jgi:4-diphosphocytidyl-2-C-methyl-D-erythritol kinase